MTPANAGSVPETPVRLSTTGVDQRDTASSTPRTIDHAAHLTGESRRRAGHEFEPRARSAAHMRIRITQGEALRIERGEPLLPGDVLELAGADPDKVNMQGACGVGGRRRSCRCPVMRLNPLADLDVIGGDVPV